jgi:hypothetical protein
MLRQLVYGCVLLVAALAGTGLNPSSAQSAQRGQPTDWGRFMHYPYVFYPQNFKQPQGSYDHLYYRYPQEMRIPVYNKNWYNFYPQPRPYHRGHHFVLDVF